MAKSTRPQAPRLSASQMQTAISKLRRRVGDLEALDPKTVRSRSDPRVIALEASIEETLSDIFGHETIVIEGPRF